MTIAVTNQDPPDSAVDQSRTASIYFEITGTNIVPDSIQVVINLGGGNWDVVVDGEPVDDPFLFEAELNIDNNLVEVTLYPQLIYRPDQSITVDVAADDDDGSGGNDWQFTTEDVPLEGIQVVQTISAS